MRSLKSWSVGVGLALPCSLAISRHACAAHAAAESSAQSEMSAEPGARANAPEPRRGFRGQFRCDLQLESHGPEGLFWGPAFGGGLVRVRAHDFVGARFYMQLYAMPHEVESNGVTFKIRETGWRFGLTAGREVADSVWLIGDLMSQYAMTTVRAVGALPPLLIKDGGGAGFGMMGSLGVVRDVGRGAMLGMSATLAVPFDRHPYDAFDTSTHQQRTLFSAWVLQPGISLTAGFF